MTTLLTEQTGAFRFSSKITFDVNRNVHIRMRFNYFEISEKFTSIIENLKYKFKQNDNESFCFTFFPSPFALEALNATAPLFRMIQRILNFENEFHTKLDI